MEKEETKKNKDKSTIEEAELNAQSINDKDADQEIEDKNEDKNIEPDKQDKERLTPEEELETLKDKLARTFAEMENQRRRFEREKEDAYEYGGYSFAKEALNLLDNLARSKTALENDEKLKETDALKKIIEHLDIINNDMLSIFKKNNIEPIKSIGEKLDPNLHQAMMEVEDDAKEPGTIVQEIQKGFTMKDRLLRPSLVGVSKKKQKDDEKEEQNDEKNQ